MKHKYIYLSIISGLMTALSFAVPSFGILVWFSLVLFFFVLFKEHNGKNAFLYGVIFAFSFYIPLCSWLYTLSSLEFINRGILILLLTLALLLISCIMSAGYGIISFLFSKYKVCDFLKPFVISSLWILLEFLAFYFLCNCIV